MLNKTIFSGVYLIYMKWDLIWFENKIKNELFTVKYYELQALLLQAFDQDYCKKILETITKFEKVIIDFDNKTVSKVIDKDIPFFDEIKSNFSAKFIAENFDPDSRTVFIENNKKGETNGTY